MPTKWWSFSKIFLLTLGFFLLNLAVLYKIDFLDYLRGTVPLFDFDIYYRIATDSLAGLHPYKLPYMQTSGPPLVILPFIPFKFFSLEQARTLINSVSLLAIMATSWVLANQFSKNYRWLFTLIFSFGLLLTFPVRFNFILGQPNLIIMWLVTLFLTSKNIESKSVLASVIILLKTNYLLLLSSFRKKWRGLFLVGVCLCIFTEISLFIFTPQIYSDYLFDKGSGFIFSQPVTTDVDYYNHSLRATVAKLQIPELYVITYAILFISAAVILFQTQDEKSAILFSLLLSPIIWQHYIVVLYPVIILMMKEIWQRKFFQSKILFPFLFATILLLLHFPQLHGKPAVFPYNWQATHFWWGVIILTLVQSYIAIISIKSKK